MPEEKAPSTKERKSLKEIMNKSKLDRFELDEFMLTEEGFGESEIEEF